MKAARELKALEGGAGAGCADWLKRLVIWAFEKWGCDDAWAGDVG